MAIGRSIESGDRKETVSFKFDDLKVELSGPEYDRFSVIDLPGLFR